MRSLISKTIALTLCIAMLTGVFSAAVQAIGDPTGAPSLVAGDINNDTNVDNKDLIRLFQFLSEWDVEVNEYAADVNNDNSTDNKDLIRLFQYLSEWDVEIFIKNNCPHDGDTELRGAKDPTCAEEGYTGDTYCLLCGMIIRRGTAIQTLPHTGGVADCHNQAVCTVCGNPYGELDPDNHTGGTEIRDAVNPTCTKEGYTGDTYCAGCNAKLAEGTVIAAIGTHGETEIRNQKDATCTEEGYTGDTYCTVCGELLYGGTVIQPTNHPNVEARGGYWPTCTVDGYSGDVYCSDCGEFLYAGSVIAARGHFGGTATYYSRAVCQVCGEEYGDFAPIRAYDQLNDNQKGIYSAIDTAVSNLEMDWFELPFDRLVSVRTMESDIRVALHAVAYDKPEYFWMPKTYSYQSTTDPFTGLINSFQMSFAFEADDAVRGFYHVTAAERAAMQAQIDGIISEITAVTDTLETDFEKEWFVHDFLCDTITYDYESAELVNTDQSADFRTYTIYGALVMKTCVCEGYSRAMQYLMNLMGIPCNLVSGLGQGGPHMWNIINPGDGLYYLDVTFDDSIEGSGIDMPGLHNYFNITKPQLEEDHVLDGVYIDGQDYSDPNTDFNFFMTYSDCTESNYYTKSGAYIYANDATDAAAFALKEWADGHTMLEYMYDEAIDSASAKMLLANALKGKLKVIGSADLPFGNYTIILFDSF